MRWQLIAQVAWAGLSRLGQLLAQLAQLLQQRVDALLLAVDGQVQRFQQVFAVAGLDLQRFHTRLQCVQTVAAHASALARQLHVPASRINDIVLERRGITADTALRLSRFFGGDAQSWLNLQTAYDLRVAELDEALQTAVLAVHPLQLQMA